MLTTCVGLELSVLPFDLFCTTPFIATAILIKSLPPPDFSNVAESILNSIDKEKQVSSTFGLSTCIASDCWTLDDELGFDAYAYTIYKFLIHNNTKPPLTISIQAPWGGGKTSLMRMIQKRLDPKALEKYQEYHKRTLDERSNKEKTKNKLTVDHVRDELKILSQGKKPEFIIPDEYDKDDRRLTIWFNVWKYESTEQVWAGLADAIIKQFGERLGPIEREKFWLHFVFFDIFLFYG